MSRAPGPALAKRLSSISKPGEFLSHTNLFPRMLKNVGFHGVESISCVCETARREILLKLLQEVVALRLGGEFHGDARLVIRRCRWRGAKIAAAQPAQPRQRAPAQLVHHVGFVVRGRSR